MGLLADNVSCEIFEGDGAIFWDEESRSSSPGRGEMLGSSETRVASSQNMAPSTSNISQDTFSASKPGFPPRGVQSLSPSGSPHGMPQRSVSLQCLPRLSTLPQGGSPQTIPRQNPPVRCAVVGCLSPNFSHIPSQCVPFHNTQPSFQSFVPKAGPSQMGIRPPQNGQC